MCKVETMKEDIKAIDKYVNWRLLSKSIDLSYPSVYRYRRWFLGQVGDKGIKHFTAKVIYDCAIELFKNDNDNRNELFLNLNSINE